MMWLKNCFNILVILTITAAKISSENNYQKFSWNKISDDNNKEAIKNRVVANFHKFLNGKTEFKNSKTATNWELIQKKRIDDIAILFNSSFVPYKDYFNFSRITGIAIAPLTEFIDFESIEKGLTTGRPLLITSEHLGDISPVSCRVFQEKV